MNGCFYRGEIYHILPEDNETGSEQYSGRPAIIVSNEANNKFAPTLEVVYLTTKPKKALPTHVSIEAARFRSIALCEQVHTVAKTRVGDYIDKLSKYEVEDVDAAIVISLGTTASLSLSVRLPSCGTLALTMMLTLRKYLLCLPLSSRKFRSGLRTSSIFPARRSRPTLLMSAFGRCTTTAM